tara:strand:+ start:105 stop:512 length:408 start_codon:yes stop_codon:yes gene_type:complete
MPITTDFNVFAERYHNTLGKKQMPVPRLPFELISSIILEATKTQHQENLDAWKQNIAQVNTSLETRVNEILSDDFYDFVDEFETWEDFVQVCWDDDENQIEGYPAYYNLFEGRLDGVNMVEPHLDDLGWWGRHYG